MKKLKLKSGMIGKAINVIQSCETYRHLLLTRKYLDLLDKNYDINYHQFDFLNDLYEDKYLDLL